MYNEAEIIIKAWQEGYADKHANKGYSNPYCKSCQKDKFKAYNNGYNTK